MKTDCVIEMKTSRLVGLSLLLTMCVIAPVLILRDQIDMVVCWISAQILTACITSLRLPVTAISLVFNRADVVMMMNNFSSTQFFAVLLLIGTIKFFKLRNSRSTPLVDSMKLVTLTIGFVVGCNTVRMALGIIASLADFKQIAGIGRLLASSPAHNILLFIVAFPLYIFLINRSIFKCSQIRPVVRNINDIGVPGR